MSARTGAHEGTRIWLFGGCLALAVTLLCVGVVAGGQRISSLPLTNPDWPVEAPPRPLAAREVRFPPYEVRTLPNGLQMVVVLHHEQPAVSMRLLVRAGSAQDPPKKAGVANLVASLLDQGTATRNAQQIADQIDSIGGAMGTGSGADLTFANAVVMKDSFQVGLELLADVVRNPAFAAEEIDRQKEQVLSSLQVSANDPDYVASALFDRLVYGFHPYGLPGTGTAETLAAITQDDLRAFHRSFFVPNNMILAIVGDVTSEEAIAGVQRVFGAWPRAEVPTVRTVEPPMPTRRVVVVDKPDAVQTEVRLGQLTIPRQHPDHFAFDLASKILGGEGANRLQRVLRSERGLTYGASADAEARKQAGDLVAETDTRTETTAEALRLAVEEFSRLQRQRVHERELADAQAFLAGSFPLTIETPNDIATQVLNAVFFELPLEEIATYRERVLAVTPDDIQRVAQQYIKPDRLSIVLVGNARAFVPELRQVGFTDIEVIPIAELDIMAGTLRRTGTTRPAARLGAPSGLRPAPLAYRPGAEGEALARIGVVPRQATAAVQAAGQAGPASNREAIELLNRVVEAKGGLAALKAIRTVRADAQTTFQMEKGPLTSTTKTYVIYPDKFRVDAEVQGVTVVQAYNAGRGWTRDPGGVRDAPAGMLEEFSSSVKRDIIPLLVGAAEGRYVVRFAQNRTDSSGATVLEIVGATLEPVRLHIDSAHLVARQSYPVAGPDGRALLSEELFSDYRSVDGVQVAYQAQVRRGGRPILTRTLTDVRINEDVDASLFEKPRAQ